MFSPTVHQRGPGRDQPRAHQPDADLRHGYDDLPGHTASEGIPQVVGNGGLPTLQLSGLSDLGHAGWVVSERFSNTLQLSDNLTKVYKSHTFKTG